MGDGIGALDGEGDDLLMRRAGTGDGIAFGLLVERHAGRARAIALRVTGNAADADELLQEAFLRAWRKAPTWHANDESATTARFSTWLIRVLVNLCIDRKRRVTPLPLEVAGDPRDETPGADRRIAERETAVRVTAAVDRLPPRQREALLLCHFESRSNEEAASMLGINVGALEALLVRARRKLRAMLEPERRDLLHGHEAWGDEG
ncbi:MAG: sigma-70 family RNA polymerase sigma factor [Rhodospirillaceae bacterium]|nr:sigma-70 family RNA polymerase sigma factor [Rhodospirillaceae bacterium]